MTREFGLPLADIKGMSPSELDWYLTDWARRQKASAER